MSKFLKISNHLKTEGVKCYHAEVGCDEVE